MRFLREALRTSGLRALRRGHRIDDGALALDDPVVEVGALDLRLHLADAGQHAEHAADAADLLHLRELVAQVLEVELALAHLLGDAPAPSRRRWSRPPSRRGRRCRPCRGCGWRRGPGWNSSSASTFSPVPTSLIGLPVTARIESAAPPRPSPSMRVSTMPVTPRRSSKARAVLTASWPVSASATSSTSCGFVAALTSAASAISASSTVTRPAVSSITTSKPPSRAASMRAARDLHGRLAGDDRQRVDADLLAEHGELLHRGRAARVERGHQHAPLVAVGEAPGDLGGGRRLARALQADHQDRRPAARR